MNENFLILECLSDLFVKMKYKIIYDLSIINND